MPKNGNTSNIHTAKIINEEQNNCTKRKKKRNKQVNNNNKGVANCFRFNDYNQVLKLLLQLGGV